MSSENNQNSLKAELLQRVRELDRSQALFPVQSEATQSIDALIQQLNSLNPNPEPLRAAALPLLLGNWQLIYASQGTVITRKLADFSPKLPIGIELQQVSQNLTMGRAGILTVTNEAKLGIPLLGNWSIAASGIWQVKDTELAQVCFHRFSLQPIQLWEQADWKLPAVNIPIFESLRRQANWRTSYLDLDLRVGRGSTGNLFLFCRPPC